MARADPAEIQIELPRTRGCRPGHEVNLLANAAAIKAGETIAELGSGVGMLALTLATRASVRVVGFELQSELVDLARRNAGLNAALLRGSVRFEQMDIRRLGGSRWEGQFDRVFANPPFHRLDQGRHSPNCKRNIARHEIEATLDDFVRAAAILLRARGRFHFIFRPERLEELLALAARHRCPIKIILPIYTRRNANAEWVIATGIKGGRPGLAIAPPSGCATGDYSS